MTRHQRRRCPRTLRLRCLLRKWSVAPRNSKNTKQQWTQRKRKRRQLRAPQLRHERELHAAGAAVEAAARNPTPRQVQGNRVLMSRMREVLRHEQEAHAAGAVFEAEARNPTPLMEHSNKASISRAKGMRSS